MGTDLTAGLCIMDGSSVTSVESLQGRVEAVSLEALLPMVRRALADDHLTVLDREVSPLPGAQEGGITRGVFRISGTARGSSGEVVPWQLVLKVDRASQLALPGTDLGRAAAAHRRSDRPGRLGGNTRLCTRPWR
jgi:hypothetical protein